jgi:antitoxin component HigA of HigAB toxin-antitoxin module
MHINFEEDKKEVLDMSTDNDKKSLSDQVEKLKDLEDSIVAKEEELKQLKQQADAISGEVIPTMMQELNISTLKLADEFGCRSQTSLRCFYFSRKKRRSI